MKRKDKEKVVYLIGSIGMLAVIVGYILDLYDFHSYTIGGLMAAIVIWSITAFLDQQWLRS